MGVLKYVMLVGHKDGSIRTLERVFIFYNRHLKNIDKCEIIAYNKNVQWNKSSLIGV